MQCPTCASPLPVGAMICGECGRTLSGVDTSAPDRPRGADERDGRPPAWSPQRPTPASSGEQPWWLRDREPADRTDAPLDPPAWRDAPPTDEPAARRDETPDAAPHAVAPTSSQPATSSEPDGPGGPAPRGGAGRPEPVSSPPQAVAPTPVPTPVPAPLREPDSRSDDGPRPSTAPLWTASLTPVASATPLPETDEAGATPDEGVGGASDLDPSRPDAQPETPSADDDAPAAPSATEPAARSSHDAATPGVDASTPRPGDTVRVEPVLPQASATPAAAPVPLVEPGQAAGVERCTQCGADVHEDDIFCGVCGAVVQSVALSFTGPIVPILRGGAPAASSEVESAADPAIAAAEPGAAVADATGPAGTGTDDDRRDRDRGRGGRDRRDRSRRDRRRRDDVEEPSREDRPVAFPEPADLTPPPTSSASPTAPPAAEAPPTVEESPAPEARPTAPETAWRPREPLRPATVDTDDDVDETRIVRRGPMGSEFVLQFSTGESVTVDGTGLVGRAPLPQPGERFDQLVRIVDPGKSVSKTHLEFGQEHGQLWLSDRWSGNGTIVRPRDEPARRLEPGTRVRVARGCRVEIGEQFFVIA
ncbi:FHA domain-containing protein [Frigoribacterium faeni]|uniref:FHA domain-containing protein n=1 Tax=Frigoribacterium faeni TaxID=145483 RepID=A0A7W3JGQ7_9MICO|nr:FHA domain-containing protein [Frigoribacterium faeni]MBA8812572.1 hypothetical protein [Frigoribacterium faeni]GEK81711.1 hypothetical protein FFA01_00200 [Frigoribacterium faeni]